MLSYDNTHQLEIEDIIIVITIWHEIVALKPRKNKQRLGLHLFRAYQLD